MYSINCNGKLLDLNSPIVMGIINITPDSFYKGSIKNTEREVLQLAEKMLNEGATILDIGGQSTRSGSEYLDADTELERVLPVIETIMRHFPHAIVSTDTFHAKVAKETVAAGASIINDISSGDLDSEMIATVAKLQVPYIVMHMKGTPQTMQKNAEYVDVVKDVIDYLVHKIYTCRMAGINDLIADPGFGFGKTLDHNYRLVKDFKLLEIVGVPLLAGFSRKTIIYKLLGTSPSEALNGTTALNMIALQRGVKILRVHDVKEAMECIKICEAINK